MSSADIYANGGQLTSSYLCDHLATFTSTDENQLTPQDGMKKLKKMEQTIGVYTMKVRLNVTSATIEVYDITTQAVIERFPLSSVRELECFSPATQRPVQSDIIIFSILDQSIHELHLFQTLERPGREFVNEVEYYKKTNIRRSKTPNVYQDEFPNSFLSPLSGKKTTGRSAFMANLNVDNARADETTEPVERQRKLLDYTFSDIETFVAQLNHIAQSFENRKKRLTVRPEGLGDGLLSMRCKTPPAKEFVDILQKFKLSFILIAKLKHIISKPNAPELIHFLFKPLLLVVSACSDPRDELPKLVQKVDNPLITDEVRNLFENCLNTSESDLWKKLGPAWISTSKQWPEKLPLYIPVFLDGFSPPISWMKEILDDGTSTSTMLQNIYSPPPQMLEEPINTEEKFLRDLITKNAKIYIVKQSRKADHPKEIALEKGAIVEVLKDEKNWWKVRNYKLESGFAPKTILKPYDK